MGSLRGDLNLIGLADLFQLLVTHHRIGTLTVSDHESRKSIYFGNDGLMVLSDGKRKGPKLGEILVRTRRLTPLDVVKITEAQKLSGIRFGEAVVKLGYLSPDEVLVTVREQVQEEIYDLFTWNEATFAFNEGPPPALLKDPDQPVATLNLDVTGFLLEAMRRIDELQVIIGELGGPETVYVLKAGVPSQEVTPASDPFLWSILQLIDGHRTIGDIITEGRLSTFQCYRAIRQIHQKGWLTRPKAGAPADPAPPASKREDQVVLVMASTPVTNRPYTADLKKAGFLLEELRDVPSVLSRIQDKTVQALVIDAPEDLKSTWIALGQITAVSRVPVIVISSCRTREGIIQTIRAGAHDYLVRPFPHPVLVDRIRKFREEGPGPVRETTIIRRATESRP